VIPRQGRGIRAGGLGAGDIDARSEEQGIPAHVLRAIKEEMEP
jgi:hypothetical protein